MKRYRYKKTFNVIFGMNNKKLLSFLIIMVFAVNILTACGNRPDSNGSLKSEDGRSYGGLIEAEMGEAVRTAFFELTVTSADKCSTYQFKDGLYIADPDQVYLEVAVTITNIYDKDLPMSISDFTLDFSDNDSDSAVIGYGSEDLMKDDFMDNIFTLKRGESITKNILYIVPDRAEYLLCYKEYYEDKFEGDTYEIKMVPEIIEPAVTTEALLDTEDTQINVEADDNTSGEASLEKPVNDDSGESDADEQDNVSGDEDGTGDVDTGIIEQ